MYQNYLFDLYGTLVDISTEEAGIGFWERVAEFYGFQGAGYAVCELQKRYLELCEEFKQEPPYYTYKEIRLERVFDRLYKEKEVEPDEVLTKYTAQVFRLLSTNYINVYEGTFELLSYMKEKGKKIYLLSNAQRSFTEYELKYLALHNKFDGIVISSDVGCTKPETAIFEYILKKYSLNKEESVMIGNDAVSDIHGAHMAGIDSIYLHSNLSPEIAGPLEATYTIFDGDLMKVKEYIRE